MTVPENQRKRGRQRRCVDMTPLEKKSCLCLDLPVTAYREVWAMQQDLVALRRDGLWDEDIVLLVEHYPVYTLGRRGGVENLKVPETFLEKMGIQVFPVERGGDITFHGPGQLVGYPIFNLHKSKIGVTDFVGYLEEVMIRAVKEWGIDAGRDQRNRGVWVRRNKLGSVGIAIRHGISFHGFALNVDMDLKPFGWINPCGLQGIGMTSMAQELSCGVSMKQVRQAVKDNMEEIFGLRLQPCELAQMREALKTRGIFPCSYTSTGLQCGGTR